MKSIKSMEFPENLPPENFRKSPPKKILKMLLKISFGMFLKNFFPPKTYFGEGWSPKNVLHDDRAPKKGT